ncbi:DUF2637 domain-containing protein [Streptomyces olivoreticuli]
MTRTLPRCDAVLVQAVIAGALSFAHLHDIARAAGQDGWKGWAYPISVDLLLVAAWRRLRSGRGVRLAWVWFLIALTVSLGANVATAGFLDLVHPPAWLRMLVAGWPAAAFLGGTLLAHSAPVAGPEGAPTPEPEPLPEPLVPVVSLERSRAPEPAAAPAPDPPAAVRPEVPAALVAHARKVAEAHRSSTGHDIDPDILRTRLGVPASMADAIVAQLA